MIGLSIKPGGECRWDAVALGEVMLRLDPRESRIAAATSFQVWEGGGEYNVVRGLASCFGRRAGIVTAFADNPVGRLVESLIRRGGVEDAQINWVEPDGIGLSVRNGLNFVERGYGVRAPAGCSDRGHTAVSQLEPGDIDWDRIFGKLGARWFHCGGIFAALSDATAEVAREAMVNAHQHGTVVSYDLNYRDSLWDANGGAKRAAEVNRSLLDEVDVLFGVGGDARCALGYDFGVVDETSDAFELRDYEALLMGILERHPGLKVVATTKRRVRSATRNDWGGVAATPAGFVTGPRLDGLEILDRVGGGDSFASGFIYALLDGQGLDTALAYGVAHGALAMTTPGDTSMATLAEVEGLVRGKAAQVIR